MSVGDKLLRRSLDVQSLIGKISARFSNCVMKVLDVGSSNRPSAGVEKVRKPGKTSGPKGPKKPTKGPSRGNENIL